jgi:alpha-N-arabinofuranosidase
VPVVDLVPVRHDDGTVVMFAVNRSQSEPATVDLDVRGLAGAVRGEHVALFDDDPDAVNSAEHPDRVTPRRMDAVTADAGTLSVVLPPLSWNMLTLRPAS